VLAAASSSAFATEGNGSSYPVGIETNYSGRLLPDGPHLFVNYSNYTANHSKNNSGLDNPALAAYKLRVNTIGMRFRYAWPGVTVWGARMETRVTQALPTTDLTLDVRRPAPLPPLDRGGSRTGLGDIAIAPLVLGWHSTTFHQVAGVEFYLKTGSYDVDRAVNTGRNYYQVAPFYAFTWQPARELELSAKFRYAVNSKNNATNYKSGQEATLEFGGGYRVAPNWVIGASGYLYRQTTDDVQNGAAVSGHGNRGRVNALGPSITYNFSPRTHLTVKIQREFSARNRPEGTRVWLMTRIPF